MGLAIGSITKWRFSDLLLEKRCVCCYLAKATCFYDALWTQRIKYTVQSPLTNLHSLCLSMRGKIRLLVYDAWKSSLAQRSQLILWHCIHAVNILLITGLNSTVFWVQYHTRRNQVVNFCFKMNQSMRSRCGVTWTLPHEAVSFAISMLSFTQSVWNQSRRNKSSLVNDQSCKTRLNSLWKLFSYNVGAL